MWLRGNGLSVFDILILVCTDCFVWNRVLGLFGGHSVEETPGLFPNPEAKLYCADGTALGRVWESRLLPNIIFSGGVPPLVWGCPVFLLLFCGCWLLCTNTIFLSSYYDSTLISILKNTIFWSPVHRLSTLLFEQLIGPTKGPRTKEAAPCRKRRRVG